MFLRSWITLQKKVIFFSDLYFIIRVVKWKKGRQIGERPKLIWLSRRSHHIKVFSVFYQPRRLVIIFFDFLSSFTSQSRWNQNKKILLKTIQLRTELNTTAACNHSSEYNWIWIQFWRLSANVKFHHSPSGVVHKWRQGLRGEGVSRILWQQY